METKEIPILLLTGYLGSGKTTLLNYLLSNREGIKFAVIMPTWAEKLVHNFGDGSSLLVHDTEIGKLGVLICGENTNTLAPS